VRSSQVEVVSEFTHLGACTTHNSSGESKILPQSGIAKKCMTLLEKHTWKSHIRVYTEIRLYRVYTGSLYLSLRPKYQTKSLQLCKRKQNKYAMNDVVAYGGIITATDRTPKICIFFPCLPVIWDDRSETWFKVFCILIRSHIMVSEEEKVTHCFSKEGSLTFLAVTRARIVQFL